MYRATIDCLEKNLPPTMSNRARMLGVRRQSVWEFDKRHPDFLVWQDNELRARTGSYWGVIELRMAMTALQGGGSPQHAEVYCKMRAQAYARQPAAEDALPLADHKFVLNLLIPRPELPPEATAVPAVIPRPSDIPVVSTR
jgi:hypothetical protein